MLNNTILTDYAGCGAYLVAVADGATNPNAPFRESDVVAIRRVPELRLPSLPVFPSRRGRLSNAERAMRREATASVYRARAAARSEWANDLRSWRPAGAQRIIVCDMSCTEIVMRHSDEAWIAFDALNGDLRAPLIEREAMARLGA